MAERTVFVDAGRRGARKRWGEPRVIRLDGLDPDRRRLVAAFVDMARATSEREKAAADLETPATADELEGHGNVRPAAE